MNRTISLRIAIPGLAILSGPALAARFSLQSSAFADAWPMPRKYAANPSCVGKKVSPPFIFAHPPAGAKKLALIAYDPKGAAGLAVTQRVACGIARDLAEIAKDGPVALSANSSTGKTAPGTLGYFGPCPPPGMPLHYNCSLIATDSAPDALAGGLTRDGLPAALKGHVQPRPVFAGRFGHP